MYDVIVVGARCAGSATATCLARRGHSVLLLDRARFPSPTLSTHVFGEWDLYRHLGVAEAIEATGAPPMTRIRVDVEGCVLEADLVLFPRAMGVRREVLDQILLDHAASHPPVEVRTETSALDLVWEDGRACGVVVRDRAGRRAVHGRAVVGADGRHSLVARLAGAEETFATPPIRCAYYAYYADMPPFPVPSVEWYWASPDIVFVTPCDGGLHTILVMPPQDEFPAWQRDPAGVLDARIQGIPSLRARVRGSRRVSRVFGLGDLRNFVRRAYGPGWALVGDAGAHVHPVAGVGIDAAVACADQLAAALHAYLAGEQPWDEALAAYQEQRDARVRPEIEGAMKAMRRTRPPEEGLAWLRMICTLPGSAHDLGRHGRAVAELVMGEQRAAECRPLVEELVREQTAAPAAVGA